MADIKSARWIDAMKTRETLIREGWKSPDTYCNCYSPIIKGSAVYLFLLYRRDDYHRVICAYVGMSTGLKTRLSGHEVLQEIRTDDYWPSRWFKPTRKEKLRETERELIERFDPAWNIIGRQRGIALS